MPVPPQISGILLVAGGTTVFGHGAPNIPSPALKICSAGPNGVPDGCGPGTDDVLLGSGGTDASGTFVHGNSAGIVLSRPLVAGEKIFAIDTQNNLTGPAVQVRPAPVIPDVNPWGATALGGALLLAMLVRLRAAGQSGLRRPRG